MSAKRLTADLETKGFVWDNAEFVSLRQAIVLESGVSSVNDLAKIDSNEWAAIIGAWKPSTDRHEKAVRISHCRISLSRTNPDIAYRF